MMSRDERAALLSAALKAAYTIPVLSPEEILRRQYVEGDIEVEEFEAELEKALGLELLAPRPGGGIGRHSALKPRRLRGLEGSTPSPGILCSTSGRLTVTNPWGDLCPQGFPRTRGLMWLAQHDSSPTARSKRA